MELDKINTELAIASIEEKELAGDTITFTLPDEIDRQIIDAFTIPAEIMDAENDSMLRYDGDVTTTEFIGTANFVNTIPVPAVSIFNIQDNSLVVKIATTGEVTLGKDVPAQFAASEFWTKLAEIGDGFQSRIQKLETELAEMELELEDEQDQRIELESILNDVCHALQIPSGDDDLVVAYARQYREHSGNFELDVSDLDRKVDYIVSYEIDFDIGTPTPEEKPAEDPVKAYERAMKLVR